MMNLGSEGVYLDEKCRTNPSRYLPGPKTPVKKLKIPILGFRGLGFRGLGFKLPINRPSGRYVMFLFGALDVHGSIFSPMSCFNVA